MVQNIFVHVTTWSFLWAFQKLNYFFCFSLIILPEIQKSSQVQNFVLKFIKVPTNACPNFRGKFLEPGVYHLIATEILESCATFTYV